MPTVTKTGLWECDYMFYTFTHLIYMPSLHCLRRTIPQGITQLQTRQRPTRSTLQLDLPLSQKSTPSAIWAGPSFPGPPWTAVPRLVGTSLLNPAGRGCSPAKTLQIRYNHCTEILNTSSVK